MSTDDEMANFFGGIMSNWRELQARGFSNVSGEMKEYKSCENCEHLDSSSDKCETHKIDVNKLDWTCTKFRRSLISTVKGGIVDGKSIGKHYKQY